VRGWAMGRESWRRRLYMSYAVMNKIERKSSKKVHTPILPNRLACKERRNGQHCFHGQIIPFLISKHTSTDYHPLATGGLLLQCNYMCLAKITYINPITPCSGELFGRFSTCIFAKDDVSPQEGSQIERGEG